MVGDFGGVSLNFSLIRQITRISRLNAESTNEMLTIVMIVWDGRIKVMKLHKLDRVINYYLFCSYCNYYG